MVLWPSATLDNEQLALCAHACAANCRFSESNGRQSASRLVFALCIFLWLTNVWLTDLTLLFSFSLLCTYSRYVCLHGRLQMLVCARLPFFSPSISRWYHLENIDMRKAVMTWVYTIVFIFSASISIEYRKIHLPWLKIAKYVKFRWNSIWNILISFGTFCANRKSLSFNFRLFTASER